MFLAFKASPNPHSCQELDEDFLIIWSGFSNPPWRTFTEPDLRVFLIERAREGFCFPMNPVWSVRDIGWYDVLQALKASPDGAMNLKSWFPVDSGVLEKIESYHMKYPAGFSTKKAEPQKPAPPPPQAADSERMDAPQQQQQQGRSMSMLTNLMDGFGQPFKQ